MKPCRRTRALRIGDSRSLSGDSLASQAGLAVAVLWPSPVSLSLGRLALLFCPLSPLPAVHLPFNGCCAEVYGAACRSRPRMSRGIFRWAGGIAQVRPRVKRKKEARLERALPIPTLLWSPMLTAEQNCRMPLNESLLAPPGYRRSMRRDGVRLDVQPGTRRSAADGARAHRCRGEVDLTVRFRTTFGQPYSLRFPAPAFRGMATKFHIDGGSRR